MSYATIEAGVLATIRLHASYPSSGSNSRAQDYNILSAASPRCVVVVPGPVERAVVAAPRRVQSFWTVYIDLFVPMRTQRSTQHTNFVAERDTLLAHLDAYPTLNGTAGVINALVVGVDDPVVWVGSRSASYMSARVRMMVEERENITIAET